LSSGQIDEALDSQEFKLVALREINLFTAVRVENVLSRLSSRGKRLYGSANGEDYRRPANLIAHYKHDARFHHPDYTDETLRASCNI